MRGSIDLLAVILGITLVAAPSAAQGDVLYGSDVVLDDLGTIDRTNGTWTSIGNTLLGGAITGLAYDPTLDVLYGCRPNNNALVTFNQATGAATTVGLTGFSNINGLAFDSNSDVLYCTDLNGNAFFTIDVNTGIGTSVATMNGASNVEGLAYDPVTDTLFGLDDTVDTIVTIDKTTGVATALPNALSVPGIWRGLTWDAASGVILASTVNPGNLYAVSPVTGIDTLIGPTQSFVQGLAFKGSAVEYETNKPGATLLIGGVIGTPTNPATVTVGLGGTVGAMFSSTSFGQLWDVAVGTMPLIGASQGAPVIGGQLLNVNPADPSFALLWNGFLSPPFVNTTVPISFGVPVSFSLQLAVLGPPATPGINFSQPVRLIFQ